MQASFPEGLSSRHPHGYFRAINLCNGTQKTARELQPPPGRTGTAEELLSALIFFEYNPVEIIPVYVDFIAVFHFDENALVVFIDIV